MKHTFLALGLFSALTITNAFSQVSEHIVGKANIPFAFQVGASSMPAGTYIVSEAGLVLRIQAASGKKSAMVVISPTTLETPVQKSSLEFNCYGSTYFLSKVSTRELQDVRSLPRSKQEKIVARNAVAPRPNEVAFEKSPLPQNGR